MDVNRIWNALNFAIWAAIIVLGFSIATYFFVLWVVGVSL